MSPLLPASMIAFGTLTGATPSPAETGESSPVRPRAYGSVVVLGLQNEDFKASKLSILNELLLTELQRQAPRSMSFTAPSDLNAIVGVEQLKDALGCDDMACAAEIGGALGADALISGRVGRLGEHILLTLKLIDLRESVVAARVRAQFPANDESQYVHILSQLVEDLGLNTREQRQIDVFPKALPTSNVESPRIAPPLPVSRWPAIAMLVGSVGILVASGYYDVAADSSNDGRLTSIDFLPIGGYALGAWCAVQGVSEMVSW